LPFGTGGPQREDDDGNDADGVLKMRNVFHNRGVKILIIAILVWIVSATYSYHISSKLYSGKSAFASTTSKEEGTFSLLWDKFSPIKMKLGAKAAIVVDASTGEVLYAKNQTSQLPIASLTKLATVLVFLETNPDLLNTITINSDEKQGAGHSKLYIGETITLRDCLHMCLMRSDNVAARALAVATGLASDEFITKMNELATRLGLENTRFVDPTGLFAGNVSTAEDYVKLAKTAFANETISTITAKHNYQFKPLNRRVVHTLYNTNRLLYSNDSVRGGKTGYISASGYCLALNAVDKTGRPIMAVLLGSPSNGYRYRDATKLLTYAMNN
jgi:D-alanyl-D-alanine endopeptidase (penicillin-binding protein 7)